MDLPVNYEELTWQERREVREEYIRIQKNLCSYCGANLYWSAAASVREKEVNWDLFPENFLKYPIHLHHDHETGMTIGAVHSYCNAVLWEYEGE